jgi:hypothetical protein
MLAWAAMPPGPAMRVLRRLVRHYRTFAGSVGSVGRVGEGERVQERWTKLDPLLSALKAAKQPDGEGR